MMSSSEKSTFDFPTEEIIQEELLSELDHISDEKLMELIIKPLNLQPERLLIAKRQLQIYFNRLSSQPKMKVFYFKKIRQLFQLEKDKGVKKNE